VSAKFLPPEAFHDPSACPLARHLHPENRGVPLCGWCIGHDPKTDKLRGQRDELLARYRVAVATIGAECYPDEEEQREAEDFIRRKESP
jgi:hypothetical protein